jgi:hypothetical protein
MLPEGGEVRVVLRGKSEFVRETLDVAGVAKPDTVLQHLIVAFGNTLLPLPANTHQSESAFK